MSWRAAGIAVCLWFAGSVAVLVGVPLFCQMIRTARARNRRRRGVLPNPHPRCVVHNTREFHERPTLRMVKS